MEPETLIGFGGTIKALGNRRIGMDAIIFSNEGDGKDILRDTSQEYFLRDTDYDLEEGEKRTIYYEHGADEEIGSMKIGKGVFRYTDTGLYAETDLKDLDADRWAEKQRKKRQDYLDYIYDMAEKGELGASTGALAHLVRREQGVNNCMKLTAWPIGECSVLTTPAEPRTRVIALKSWQDARKKPGAEIKGDALGEMSETNACVAALSSLNNDLMNRIYMILYGYDQNENTEPSVPDQIAACRPCFEEYSASAIAMIEAILTATEGEEAKALQGFFAQKVKSFTTSRQFEGFLREAGFSRKMATAITLHGFQTSLRDAVDDEPKTAKSEYLTELAEAEQKGRERRLAELAVKTQSYVQGRLYHGIGFGNQNDAGGSERPPV